MWLARNCLCDDNGPSNRPGLLKTCFCALFVSVSLALIARLRARDACIISFKVARGGLCAPKCAHVPTTHARAFASRTEIVSSAAAVRRLQHAAHCTAFIKYIMWTAKGRRNSEANEKKNQQHAIRIASAVVFNVVPSHNPSIKRSVLCGARSGREKCVYVCACVRRRRTHYLWVHIVSWPLMTTTTTAAEDRRGESRNARHSLIIARCEHPWRACTFWGHELMACVCVCVGSVLIRHQHINKKTR